MTTETSEIDWKKTPAYEPGSVNRHSYYDKKPVLHPSVEEQVKSAQEHNRERYFSGSHEHVQLYMLEDDCEHTDPEYLDKYLGVDELLDEWMQQNHPEYAGHNPHKFEWYDHSKPASPYQKWNDEKWVLRKEGIQAIPLYAEFDAAMAEYQEKHNGVCLLEPMETCCKYCNEEELEYGEGVSENHCDYGRKDTWEVEEFWCLFETRPDTQ